MEKKLRRIGVMAVMAVIAMLATSCMGPSYWYDDSDYYDHRLDGYWELVQVDSRPVYDGDQNFFYFNGYGRGYYYYWDYGRRYVDNTYYESQPSVNGASRYQLNLQIGNDRPTTVNYWFTAGNNTLFMQWIPWGSSAPVTYVYDRIGRAPW